MIPIHDDNPTQINPWVTKVLIIINLIVFALQFLVIVSEPEQVEKIIYTGAFIPCQLAQSCPSDIPAATFTFPAWLTLITSQFMHGGIGHIVGNMLFLSIFGNNIEDCLGHFKFLIFYILCGIAAALIQGFSSPDSIIPLLGASGAIAGVLGAYLIRFPRAKLLVIFPFFPFIPMRLPAYFFLILWFAFQFIAGTSTANIDTATGEEVGGVAYWAHAGGFIFGIILAPILGLFSSRGGANN
ncbi:MAG: rhomboid family intramembrane serine protease [Limnospira sp. PMC 1291.21]|nr:rhomboid family intramembrane serine protease [Limnospira indica]MDT9178732.1 rhomboid family intramembrane serine protease [Limnospira sp. PMC 1238.20]MDT9188814.1 rhomboid family intramembrane serine protease [Limnospira sp. PMC 894.15]MDT9193500.1 rhomboid family intramembrane serine protease [Limnospira sp. PMC 1245.20]MDT9204200.1 rhomboid family intramembrane serine protease [Limnospira sp. PMC 1243.20]MDT9208938.1 rhomboid family intramembrane serine protease [Limnospira sp. PMC 1252